MDSRTIAGRLKRARNRAGLSINQLHKLLQADGVRGSSYGSVRNYETGRSEPPLEFIIGAARLLNVNQRWLATGETAIDALELHREADREAEAARLQARLRPMKQDEEWLERAAPGRTARAKHLRAALLRFARLLDDAETALTPWSDSGERWRVLRDALDFLSRADRAFDELLLERRKDASWADSVHAPLPDADPRATVMWYDALLGAFAQRVAGLGLPVDAVPKMTEGVEAAAEAPKVKQRARRTPSKKRTSIPKEG